MNEYRKDERRWCFFHPRELVIGICALCLNQRLLVLAAKQGTIHHHPQTHKNYSATPNKAPISLTKIFTLTCLLNLLEIKRQKPDQDCHSSSTSPEDSFISMKFENNGVASWDKGKISKMPFDQQCKVPWKDKAKKIKSVVEHAKPRAVLRWRRRIGHLLRIVRLKKSTKGNMCHGHKAQLEGVKVKYGTKE